MFGAFVSIYLAYRSDKKEIRYPKEVVDSNLKRRAVNEDIKEVGLTHSRGVAEVILCEP